MARVRDQKWQAREALREKGQFWTPSWVAKPMVRYALNGGDTVFDVGVGAAAFGKALREVRPDLEPRFQLAYLGCEIDEDALEQAVASGLPQTHLSGIQLADFLSIKDINNANGIVSNPPYVRHHRISQEKKGRLRHLTARYGLRIDGRAGLHVFFLIHALTLLRAGQRLAFIVPSDVAEGVFAPTLWEWISREFCIDAVIKFSPEATPFPGVDTNPLVLFISNLPPKDSMFQVICHDPERDDFDQWVTQGLAEGDFGSLSIQRVPVKEAVYRGVGRSPVTLEERGVPLSVFASTLRGIATGANEYFLMTQEQAHDNGIDNEYLLRIIGKTRDATTDIIHLNDLSILDAKGIPTYLLALDGRPKHLFPQAIQDYLKVGEALGFPERALISTRNPWYKMEKRVPPAFLFSYLGRRNSRFIKNEACAVPSTGFLCVYPRYDDSSFINSLWQALNHPKTLHGLHLVGKSYGGGAIKVEPKALLKLLIPNSVINETGLDSWIEDPKSRGSELQRQLFPIAL